ncbi:MAG: hypothetical protein KDI61_00210 [Alphaproteobacteria bacterium]|nr:hypothetical protein [Alphaproteobacteria bacterium]
MVLADQLPRIECQVTFHNDLEGWPQSWPKRLSGCVYRPHIVVGDPTQRSAILTSKVVDAEYSDGTPFQYVTDKFIDELYCGVVFEKGPENPELGKSLRVSLIPMFWPDETRPKLEGGTTFTIREGATVVGFGIVLQWIS